MEVVVLDSDVYISVILHEQCYMLELGFNIDLLLKGCRKHNKIQLKSDY